MRKFLVNLVQQTKKLEDARGLKINYEAEKDGYDHKQTKAGIYSITEFG